MSQFSWQDFKQHKSQNKYTSIAIYFVKRQVYPTSLDIIRCHRWYDTWYFSKRERMPISNFKYLTKSLSSGTLKCRTSQIAGPISTCTGCISIHKRLSQSNRRIVFFYGQIILEHQRHILESAYNLELRTIWLIKPGSAPATRAVQCIPGLTSNDVADRMSKRFISRGSQSEEIQ